MSDRFDILDQALLELAIKYPATLESLKKHHMSYLSCVKEELENHYKLFDDIYIKSRNYFPVFEKNLLKLENIKQNCESYIEEIERLIEERELRKGQTPS